MTDLLVQYVLMPAVGYALARIFGPKAWSAIQKHARQIMADPGDPITSPRDALKKALDIAYQEYMDHGVAELERLQAEGKLAAQAAEARGNHLDTTIVPRDGTEEFRSPWKDKQP